MFEWPEQIQHLDLHDIRPYTKVSAAAFTACRANDLLSVPKLLKHYAEDTDFLTLRKATIIAREHLKKVCIWLLDHRDLLVRELAEPSADEIAPHHFSTRKLRFIDIKFRERYNTLFFRWPVAGLEVLFKGDYTYQKCHQIFFEDCADLMHLRNVGKSSIPEIKKFLRAVRADAFAVLRQPDEIFDNHPEVRRHYEEIMLPYPHELAPDKFTIAKISELNIHIERWFDQLPTRAQNALKYGIKNPTNYACLYAAFLKHDQPDVALRNVGESTIGDIKAFLTKINNLAASLLSKPDQAFEEQIATEQICRVFCLNAETLAPYLEADTEEDRFPLFRYLHEWITDKMDLDDEVKRFIRDDLGWFSGKQWFKQAPRLRKKVRLPSGQRTNKLNSTLKKRVFEQVGELWPCNPLFTRIVRNYNMDERQDVILLSTHLCQVINQSEGSDFSLRFFYAILSARYARTHNDFGYRVIISPYRYLIRHDLLEIFSVEAFFSYTNAIVIERRDHDYAVCWSTHVARFLKPGYTPQDLKRALKAASALVEAEFASFVVFPNENEAVFTRRIKKEYWEYTFEALETIGIPANITLIHQTILDKYPNVVLKVETLKRKIVDDKERFIYISRTGLYGLAKWETERLDIRGGSIRDLIAEYLKNSGQPRHCREITEYLLPLRSGTSYNSVHNNLLLDKSGRFIKFPNKFWGLSDAI